MHYTNTTTRRMEAYARARGLDIGIAKHDSNSAGVFFVICRDGEPLTRWVSLGWTRTEAELAIERMARGEPGMTPGRYVDYA